MMYLHAIIPGVSPSIIPFGSTQATGFCQAVDRALTNLTRGLVSVGSRTVSATFSRGAPASSAAPHIALLLLCLALPGAPDSGEEAAEAESMSSREYVLAQMPSMPWSEMKKRYSSGEIVFRSCVDEYFAVLQEQKFQLLIHKVFEKYGFPKPQNISALITRLANLQIIPSDENISLDDLRSLLENNPICKRLCKVIEWLDWESAIELANIELAQHPEGIMSLNLSELVGLKEIPDWIQKWIQKVPGLEELNLSGCHSLEGLPASIGKMEGLKVIDLSNCWKMKELPDEIGKMTGLEELNLSGCHSLERLPASIGKMEGLKVIDLSNCRSIKELPDEMGEMTGLEQLILSGCWSLERLPSSRGKLMLNYLDLSNCEKLKKLPGWIGEMVDLKELRLQRWPITALPIWINGLRHLEVLDLYGCRALASLPDSMGEWKSLRQLHLGKCSNLSPLSSQLHNLPNLLIFGRAL